MPNHSYGIIMVGAQFITPDSFRPQQKRNCQKACDGYCHCEGPGHTVAQIKNRYDHYAEEDPAAMTERRHGL